MARLALCFGLLSVWLALLLLGWSLGGAVYLLLVAAVAVFPWRLLRLEAGDAAAPAPAEDASRPAGGTAGDAGSAAGR